MKVALGSDVTPPPWSPNKSPNNERNYIPKATKHWSQTPGEATDDVPADKLFITGGLYDSLRPIKDNNITKSHRVILKYKVRLHLTQPIKASRLVAQLTGTKLLTVVQDTGMGIESEHYSEGVVRIQWELWKGETLDAGKTHTFTVLGELPPKAPRTIATKTGVVMYELKVFFEDISNAGRVRRTMQKVTVENPFSLNPDSPTADVKFGSDMESTPIQMIGSTLDVNDKISVFAETPDQCFKGADLRFPLHLMLKATNPNDDPKHHVSRIDCRIVQEIKWLYHGRLVETDVYPCTDTIEMNVADSQLVGDGSKDVWMRCQIPVADDRVHGRYDSTHFIVRHNLELLVYPHHKSRLMSAIFSKRYRLCEPVEIYHKDVAMLLAGVEGYVEAEVGADPFELAKRLQKAQVSRNNQDAE